MKKAQNPEKIYRWKKKNPEKVKEQKRRWYALHKTEQKIRKILGNIQNEGNCLQ